jgi:NitT/TauT family transport system permease protein
VHAAVTVTDPTSATASVGGAAARGPARAGLPKRAWHTFWTLRDPISGRLRVSLMVVSAVVPFAVWLVLSGTGAIDPVFLPSPAAVFRAGTELWSSGALASDLSATMTRIGIGFGLVVLISVPLGLGIGTFPSLRALFEPMIGLLRYMPAPAFIPLLIIWLGLGETSKIALLVIGTVFFNTLMSADAANLVPRELIDASYTLGASRATVLRKVVLPHSLPGIIDAMRVNIAATFNLVVVAELIAAQSGLGYRITRAQRFLQTDQIFFVLIVIGIIGLSIDLGFRGLRNLVAPWAR